MAGAERIDKTHPMAESFSEAKAALEEVFRFYKWGRHGKDFPEKIYLLLTRCAYVCFSLWRSHQEHEGGFFHRSPAPGIFGLDLDFGEMRSQQPEGGVPPADSHEDDLTNNTKWFEFWMRILEQFDPHGSPLYQEFARQILACVGHRDWLKARTDRRSRKNLCLFLQRDEAGRVLLRTIAVLEDTIRAILRYFSTLDGRTRLLEKITLLTGLLSEMRQIIVWETPARGPYAPWRDGRWKGRSPLTWWSCGRTRGMLTVIPRREGGEIICIYSPPADMKGRHSSWVRQVASLRGSYEEELFATWSYDTGEHRKNPQHFPGLTACWTVQYAEAQRLESLARQVDLLLAALQGNPRCKPLVGSVGGLLRNGSPRWKATMLPWTYVRELDQLLEKLTLTYRQAKALGGDGATEHVVAQNWPATGTTSQLAGLSRQRPCPDGEIAREATATTETFTPEAAESPASGVDVSPLEESQPSSGSAEQWIPEPPTPESRVTVPNEEPQQSSGSAEPCMPEPSVPESSVVVPKEEAGAETTAKEPAAKPELSEDDSRVESAVPAHEENPVLASSGTIGSLEPQASAAAAPGAEFPPIDSECLVAPPAPEEPETKPVRGRKTTNANGPEEAADALLQRLLEHHGGLAGTVSYEPLSAAELQRSLGWNSSKVQRAMTKIFGPQPARAYRSKCQDRTIVTFLKRRARDVRQFARSDALT